MTLTSTLIVPVYNEAAYLTQFLDSVVSQTLPLNQIILCDNNSTDKSVEIINSYRSKLPLTLIFEPIQGILPALQTAFKYATGDLILRTDADCLLPSEWHQNIQAHFLADSNLSALTGPWYGYDGHILHRFLLFFSGSLGASLVPLIRGYPLLQGCNTAVRTSALNAINGYLTHQNITDDQLLSNKLHQAGFKLGFFWRCFLYTSTRRYQRHPQEYFYSFASLFFPHLYHPKKN